MLCNDERYASAPARSESWGVVDVQVDFTVPAVYPKGQPSADQSRSKVGADHPCYRREVAQQLFKVEIIMRLRSNRNKTVFLGIHLKMLTTLKLSTGKSMNPHLTAYLHSIPTSPNKLYASLEPFALKFCPFFTLPIESESGKRRESVNFFDVFFLAILVPALGSKASTI